MTALAVCLACRAVLPAGAACPVDPAHRAVSLGDRDGRAALIDAVWGPASDRSFTLRELQQGARRQLRASAFGLAAGSSGGMFLGSLTLAMMGAAAGAAVGQVIGALRARRRIPEFPRGADDVAAPPRVARGRIRRATGDESPASGSPCAVWALELRLEGAWGERIMLRAGATGGLEITLDGGASARVPAGPVMVVGAMSQLDDIESAVLADYLRGVDPARSDDPEPFPPIPYNVVVEHTAVSGDRIELLGVLVPDVLITGRPRLYRDAPATVLVPAGVPLIRFG